MISIKSFLEHKNPSTGPDRDLMGALAQMSRSLLDAMGAHAVRGRDSDLNILRRTLHQLVGQIDAPQSPATLLGIASDAASAMEVYAQSTAEYFRQEREQLQSMVAMLTQTLADVSGQTDASIARLQTIEKSLEVASGLNDMRAVRANLQSCLLSVREAVAHQRASSASTVQRIQSRIDQFQQQTSRQDPVESSSEQGGGHPRRDLSSEPAEVATKVRSNSYIAAFKLQRAESITNRFGESVMEQMLSAIEARLTTVLGPDDRLLRWRGTSFVMFITSIAPIREIRGRLHEAVAATRKQYFELGSKSAMLAVGVDWFVFPQPEDKSLETVLCEVEEFLNDGPKAVPAVVIHR